MRFFYNICGSENYASWREWMFDRGGGKWGRIKRTGRKLFKLGMNVFCLSGRQWEGENLWATCWMWMLDAEAVGGIVIIAHGRSPTTILTFQMWINNNLHAVFAATSALRFGIWEIAIKINFVFYLTLFTSIVWKFLNDQNRLLRFLE